MDGRTGNRTDGRTNGRSDERTNGRMIGRTVARSDGRTDGRSDEGTNDGRSDERTDGRSDGRASNGATSDDVKEISGRGETRNPLEIRERPAVRPFGRKHLAGGTQTEKQPGPKQTGQSANPARSRARLPGAQSARTPRSSERSNLRTPSWRAFAPLATRQKKTRNHWRHRDRRLRGVNLPPLPFSGSAMLATPLTKGRRAGRTETRR